MQCVSHYFLQYSGLIKNKVYSRSQRNQDSFYYSAYNIQLFSVAGVASYAQARVWLDARRRFYPDQSQLSIYNMPFIYRLHSGNALSTTQLHQALHKITIKHQSLRTSLNFNSETDILMQRIINSINDDKNDLFTFIESIYETDEQLHNIIYDEQTNSQHFDLAQGRVFRCHIIYYKQISSNHLLQDKDLLIFNFHHALFDFSSMDIFLDDLNKAYTINQLSTDNNTTLRYLDCKYQFSFVSHIFIELFRRCY